MAAFHLARGLPATGMLDAATWAALQEGQPEALPKQWWKGDAINPYRALRQAATAVAAR